MPVYSEELVEQKYKQALAITSPGQVINPGLITESYIQSSWDSDRRQSHMNYYSWEGDIWLVCKPDVGLADAVYEYSQKV